MAAVIVENDAKVLLVRHFRPGAYDFCVEPGGGALGDEDLWAIAMCKALEECGLHIEPDRVLHIEEFAQPGQRRRKVSFGPPRGGILDGGAPAAKIGIYRRGRHGATASGCEHRTGRKS
ncbi:MAG: NUDIX domain-containing protein [Burkholderiaceae bacterium]